MRAADLWALVRRPLRLAGIGAAVVVVWAFLVLLGIFNGGG